jgi:hypothetical protein
MPSWLVIAAAIIVPGSGHVLQGRPMRGLLLLFWMIIFGYITFHLTRENVTMIGRLSGGIAVWAISVVEVAHLSHRRAAK